ncbi:MAG: type II secretion system F family protein [bacterium]|nr:type II secretion system F family protein [bacterium]
MEYEYKAISKDGKKIEGVKMADSQIALARALRDEGLFLVFAKEKGAMGSAPEPVSILKKDVFNSLESLFKYVSLQEKVIFARHLGLMIRAGFSLNKALDTLSRQTKNKYFSEVLKNISARVASGESFSQAISRHPNVFPDLFVSMAKVGEASGKLESTLKLVMRHLRREHMIKKKIQGALVYPIIIVLAMLGVGVVMMTFVLPQLANTFTELNVPLPLSTQIIFSLSNFMSNYWYLFIFSLAFVSYASYFIFRKTKFGKKTVNLFLLKTPIFSDITKKINSARFSRTLSSLLLGGIPLVEAIRITSDSLTNYFYKKAVAETIAEIEKGKNLSFLLGKYPDLFPPVVTEMIAVGEETGSLADILKELARFFESEVAIATKSMSSVIEPVIMIFMGVAVGIFALSIIQPIYSIGTGL